MDQQEEQGEKKSAKEALMMWCQRNTRGYREVHIRVRDISTTFHSGEALDCKTFVLRKSVCHLAIFSLNEI